MPVDDEKSLLSFICPRMQSFGTIDGFRLSMVNRNLLAEFDACDTKTRPHNELMKVFLRIKPLRNLPDSKNSQPVIKCLNRHTVVACPPENQRVTIRDTKRAAHNFTFSQVFDCTTSQSTLFDAVALHQIRGFLEGLNGLIFAYGTTSSGKTYTLQGSNGDLGMIPRAFSMIFSAVRHTSNFSLFPKDYSDVATLGSLEIERITKEKATLLRLAGTLNEESFEAFDKQLSQPSEKAQNLLSKDNDPAAEFTPMVPVKEEACPKYTSELRFTFWISFAEIYNELIFDLLDPTQCISVTNLLQPPNLSRGGVTTGAQKNMFSTTTQPMQSFDSSNRLRKKPLELRTDKNGNIFIKGLRWYPVNSPEEAFRLITVGKQCQKVAATRLNQASSRSHSILTIKAVRVVDKENPRFARISSLTFCDLAGSERTEKAATGGQVMRMREAANINTSLLTLGRCIDCLRYNQIHPDNPKLVPYRDSKLTRLFQGFFTGRGKACMVVNASPSPDLFDETLHTLRFSALAKQIVVQTNEIVETTIVDPSGKAQAPGRQLPKPGVNVRGQIANQPVQRTPATIVPNKKARPIVAVESTRWSSADEDEVSTTVVEDENIATNATNTDTDNPEASTFDPMSSPHTPAGDSTGLILDDYTRDELMFMVKELSEQLFEAKGELVEQEARLRQEMCEALNRQLVEFEQLYENSWNAQEKLMIEKSNRRLQYYAELATKRSGMGKRRRCDDSEASSEDEVSGDEYSSFYETEPKTKDPEFPSSSMIPTKRVLTDSVGDDVRYPLSLPDSSKELSEAQDHIHDLEGELADQRDVIENFSKERDQLRMQITRLEFANAQLQQQLDVVQMSEKLKPSQVTIAVQTDTFTCDESGVLKSPSQVNSAVSMTSYTMFDDSAVSIHLPKVKNASALKATGQKFFEPYVSPEQQLRLTQSSGITSPVCQTPQTVIKLPARHALRDTLTESVTDQLREENQQLLARLAQMRQCVQKVIEQKQEAELELSRLQSQSVCFGAGDQSRMSEGLQSFLEHESRLQHMETMEQLRQQVYELEEQFATKHDTLVRTEAAYHQVKNENTELSQRVLAQADELRRINQELFKTRAMLDTELKATKAKLVQEHELALKQLREQTNATIDMQHQQLATLKARAPDRDVAVQFGPEPITVLGCAVQTMEATADQRYSIALQTSLENSRHSVGLQTNCSYRMDSPNLGSPILPPQPCPSSDCAINTKHTQEPSKRTRKSLPHEVTTTNSEVDQTAADNVTHSPSPVQSNHPTRKLRLRRGRRRGATANATNVNRPPKLPSPVSTGLFVSDSESDAGKSSRVGYKENQRPTNDEACDADLDEEVEDIKCYGSETLRGATRHTSTTTNNDALLTTGRRTRSASRKTASDSTGFSGSVPAGRERKTHSAVVSRTRRLPPLAESTQLMPDSFFQDELDQAVDQVYADFRRREEYPAFKQPVTRQQPRRRR